MTSKIQNKFNNYIVRDQFFDHIPLISTINSVHSIYYKTYLYCTPNWKDRLISYDHSEEIVKYYQYLEKKSLTRIFLSSLPFVGNFLLAWIDECCKNIHNDQKIPNFIFNNLSFLATPDLLQEAQFIGKLIDLHGSHAIFHADKPLINDEIFILNKISCTEELLKNLYKSNSNLTKNTSFIKKMIELRPSIASSLYELDEKMADREEIKKIILFKNPMSSLKRYTDQPPLFDQTVDEIIKFYLQDALINHKTNKLIQRLTKIFTDILDFYKKDKTYLLNLLKKERTIREELASKFKFFRPPALTNLKNTNFTNDLEVMLTAISICSFYIEQIGDDLKNDNSFLKKAIIRNPDCFETILIMQKDPFKSDAELIDFIKQLASSTSSSFLRQIPNRILQDSTNITEISRTHPKIIGRCPLHHLEDKNFVESIFDKIDIFHNAQREKILDFFVRNPTENLPDLSFLKKLVAIEPSFYLYIKQANKENEHLSKEQLRELEIETFIALPSTPLPIFEDSFNPTELQLIAQKSPEFLGHHQQELKFFLDDPEFMKPILKVQGIAIRYASSNLKNCDHLAQIAIEDTPYALKYLSERLQRKLLKSQEIHS